jgi:hypothetical protein
MLEYKKILKDRNWPVIAVADLNNNRYLERDERQVTG